MRIVVQPAIRKAKISKHVQGHFAEHLGRCIYGGLFVGKNNKIENKNGVRSDVVDALRKINIPNLRWPGGCFADEYHWRDGIGPLEKRKKMINNHWGGVVEDNSFGTHEFYDLCEQLGCEPYINGNLGSGTIQEMQEWVEYMTSAESSPMTQLRSENGREAPWRMKYFGVGNESWGCGGTMRAEYYADEYRRYQTYVRNYSGNKVYKIACGAGCGIPNPSYDWTEKLMARAGFAMDGLSLHYYTISGDKWEDKGYSTEFDQALYYKTLNHAAFLDELLKGHIAIMDRHDPGARVGLIVDEWGTWYQVEPGTNPGFLYQQNTMRDAMVAAISLNIMNQHARRVHMANIAQLVNVLQAPILTEGEKMLLTPTYYVFDLFKGHQEGTLIQTGIENEWIDAATPVEQASVSSSINDAGEVTITLANLHGEKPLPIALRLDNGSYTLKQAKMLTSDIHGMNTFEEPEQVKLRTLDGIATEFQANGTEATFTMPSCCVAALTFTPVQQ